MKKIIIASIAAVALVGCSSQVAEPSPTVTVTQEAPSVDDPPTAQSQSNEDLYVNGIRSMNNPILNSATDAQLIKMGRSVCDALDAGFSTDDIIQYMARQMVGQGMTSDVESQAVGYIIGAADLLLCPSASF